MQRKLASWAERRLKASEIEQKKIASFQSHFLHEDGSNVGQIPGFCLLMNNERALAVNLFGFGLLDIAETPTPKQQMPVNFI